MAGISSSSRVAVSKSPPKMTTQQRTPSLSIGVGASGLAVGGGGAGGSITVGQLLRAHREQSERIDVKIV
jgi:hypothetical protein